MRRRGGGALKDPSCPPGRILARVAAGGGRAGAQERAGKGAFSPQCAEQIGNSSAEVIGSVGRSALERLPPRAPSPRSITAQQISPDAGRFGSNPAVVWIALACLASCGTWAFGQDTAPRSPQGPVSQRSLSPKPTHMCSIRAPWPAGPHPAPPGAWSPRWQLALHFAGGAGGTAAPPAWPPPGPGPSRGAERTPPSIARLRPGNS